MVYEIHSLLGDEVERDLPARGLAFRAYQRLERKVFRHAAAVIAPGEPLKQVVVEEKGVPEDRVHVIYPGIDLAAYEEHGEPAQIPGVNDEHKVIMYVGGIVHANQGVPILIESLPSVFGSLPQARCVLVGGSAEAAAEYRKRLGEHAEKLIALADQTPAQVVALARRADVLVHPRLACRANYSVHSEIAVYLAAGRPIVATDFGDYQQLLGDTGAGLLCAVAPEPLAESIKKVLTDPALAARLAAATAPVAREYFAMDRNIERYLEVYYRALVAGPRL
jgi:D-inositol-3-phosphate glycosyltransferase